MTNLNNECGIIAAFEEYLDGLYYEGFAKRLSPSDYEFFFNEYKNA